jgi:adenosylcobyric acid synthase
LARQNLARQNLARENTPLVGLCGGYQMLGRTIRDPDHVESPVDEVAGLDLLPIETTFEGKKATHRAQAVVLRAPGWLSPLRGEVLQGYEIHVGRTSTTRPWLEIAQRSGQRVSLRDGAASDDGRVWGCYLHGLFENDRLRHAWLATLGWRAGGAQVSAGDRYEAAFERLADAVEDALDVRSLDEIVGYGPRETS